MKKQFFAIILLVFLHLTSGAQNTGSYVLNADSTVTFTVSFTGAKKVRVEGTFASKKEAKRHNIKYKKGGYVMQQNGNLWTCTTQPLPSEMYAYRFKVDKKHRLDPASTAITRDITDTLNYFFVPGEVADHYIDRDIPHGHIDKVWYPSTLNGMSQRRMFIYTPAGYYSNLFRNYPVLYLLHGSGGDETAWSDYGRATQILDELIHTGACQPMIVVMPNGNVELDAAPGESPYMNKKPKSNNMKSMFGKVEAAFPREIITYVEKHYRVIPDKSHRAIAGLSLGGLQTLFIAANNPDTFDFVGLFSAQTKDIGTLIDSHASFDLPRITDKQQRLRVINYVLNGNLPTHGGLSGKFDDVYIYDSLEQKLIRQYQTPPKLYYVAIGRDDFMMSKALKKKFSTAKDYFDKNNLPYEYHLTDGSHCWENWRKYLVDFLPKIFKK